MSVLIGTTVTISTEIFDSDGALADPTTIILEIIDPTGAVTTRNWPDPLTITKDATGKFHYDVVASVVGQWSFKWSTTGIVSITRGGFDVEAMLEKVTIRTRDGGAVAISGSDVKVKKTNGVEVVLSGTSNALGEVVGYIPPGTYIVEATRDKTSFPVTTITVTNTGGATPQEFNITGTLITISSPTPVAAIVVFGYTQDMYGRAKSGVRVVVETFANGIPNNVEGAGTGTTPARVGVQGGEVWESFSDSNGYWETRLVPGTLARIRIPSTGENRLFRVPTKNPTNLTDVRPELTASAYGLK